MSLIRHQNPKFESLSNEMDTNKRDIFSLFDPTKFNKIINPCKFVVAPFAATKNNP